MKKNNPIDVQVGANIKKIRAMRGLSRQQLGDGLSEPVAQQAIEKYEIGTNRISASTLAEVAVLLMCNVSDLFHGVGNIIKGDSPEITIHNKSDQDMLKNYHSLDDGMQAAVRNLTKALKIEGEKNHKS